MFRALAAAILLSVASPAGASSPNDQLRHAVAQELPGYGFDVDASTLSRSQLAAIYQIMHASKTEGDKRGLIASVLGGRYSLRNLLFR